ncbi:RNA polymerase sigma-70 factor, ECF subfamily [Clostridium cavendishii DSM 21758]|uniref:RNA polymerase sigma-70 factor, ECF subfamily n=1 Tax=Clostridium cavendishii DSM 21758 TaxID=1121302 RepID=A0A1M6CM60_9CLOT|nr:RNA polymerase sigma factor [Clostridium cavendishii]SHI61798.1 RNA polymerase sigma-70 factor, ECF subfamily [Clostridium cavendishii DSM 21758]
MDDQFIWQIWDKDKNKALELFIVKYKTSLYKLCFNLTRNQTNAEDLFQDTFIKAFRYMDKFDRTRDFEPWLFTIAINLYKDSYRKIKKYFAKFIDFKDDTEKNLLIENIPSDLYLPEQEMEKNEIKKLLQKSINKLKDDYKIIIILFYYNNLKQKDIALILNIPEGTVKSRLNTAKKILKKYMEEANYD